MFGREGGSVRMFNDQGELDVEDQEGFDTSQLFGEVYQARAELPRITFHNGDNHLLTGVFIINGVPCGLLGRAGGLITGNTSQFVAIGVREIEK
jgi:glutathionylspermidine synthase